MSSYTTPFFSKLGKGLSDLLKKKFDCGDFCNSLQSKSTSDNIVVTTGVNCCSSSGKLWGNLDTKYKDPQYEVKVGLNTGKKVSTTVTAVKVAPSTDVEVSVGNNPCKGEELAASVTAKYREDFLAVEGGVKVNSVLNAGRTVDINAAVVAGFDGLAVGAKTVLKPQAEQLLDSLDFAAQYDVNQHAQISATVGNFVKKASVGYYQSLNSQSSVGAGISWTLNEPEEAEEGAAEAAADAGEEEDAEAAAPTWDTALGFGFAHDLDANTTLKGVVCTGSQTVSANVTHSLKDPSVQISISSAWGLSCSKGECEEGSGNWNCCNLTAQKFGVGFTFGEYAA